MKAELVDQTSTPCYRLRPKFRNIGIMAIVFGMAMGAWSVPVALFNVDGSVPNPVLAASLFAIIWSGLTMLGVVLVLQYYRYRLFINDSALLQVGIIRRQQADLQFVDNLTWRLFPQGGSARLSGDFGVIKIDLGNITPEHRDDVIAVLHRSIAESKQHQWSEFCQQFADTPEKRERERRVLLRIGWLFIAIGVAFSAASFAGLNAKLLAAAAMNTIGGVAMLLRGYKQSSTGSSHAADGSDETPGRD